jgi:uncharacterized protein (TIGR02145 family)
MTQLAANNFGWRGTDQGSQMKESGTEHWFSGNTGTNLSGFTALPGGYRNNFGFSNIGDYGYWWSTNSYYDNVWYRFLYYNSESVGRYDGQKTNGFSVRCIKD